MALGTKPETRPTAGSFTICFTCGHIMAFNPDLTTRNLTDQEMLMIAGSRDLLRAQNARVKTLEAIDRRQRTMLRAQAEEITRMKNEKR
jgi:hypothetical protein